MKSTVVILALKHLNIAAHVKKRLHLKAYNTGTYTVTVKT